MIPQFDLKKEYALLENEIQGKLNEVFSNLKLYSYTRTLLQI